MIGSSCHGSALRHRRFQNFDARVSGIARRSATPERIDFFGYQATQTDDCCYQYPTDNSFDPSWHRRPPKKDLIAAALGTVPHICISNLDENKKVTSI